MRVKDIHFGTWDKRDYKGRVIVAVYTNELLDWIVTQDPTNIEIYENRQSPSRAIPMLIVVGIPAKLYTLMALKW